MVWANLGYTVRPSLKTRTKQRQRQTGAGTGRGVREGKREGKRGGREMRGEGKGGEGRGREGRRVHNSKNIIILVKLYQREGSCVNTFPAPASSSSA